MPSQTSTSDQDDRDVAAIGAWVELVCADHTAAEHACLNAAWKIADEANKELSRPDQPDTIPLRGEGWIRLALSAYLRLRQAGAYTHLDAAPVCQADPDRIRAWLNQPSGVPAFAQNTVADVFDFDDAFTDEPEHNLVTLVEQSQLAGVFGIPGHEITIWRLSAEDRWADGYLLTLDTPAGARYCSPFLSPTEVIAPDLTGTEAVIDTLTGLAATVNTILANTPSQRQPQAATTTTRSVPPIHTIGPTPATPATSRAAEAGEAARARIAAGFTALVTTNSTVTAQPPSPQDLISPVTPPIRRHR